MSYTVWRNKEKRERKNGNVLIFEGDEGRKELERRQNKKSINRAAHSGLICFLQ